MTNHGGVKRVVVALLFVAPFGYLLYLIVGTNSPPERVSAAATAVLTFVSFLTAGWTAGFSYFWKSFSEEASLLEAISLNDEVEKKAKKGLDLVRLWTLLKGWDKAMGKPPAEGEDRAPDAFMDNALRELMKSIDKSGPHRALNVGYLVAIGSLLNFALCGLVCVLSILTGSLMYLTAAIVLLILGLGFMLVGWQRLMRLTEEFRARRALVAASKSYLDELQKIEETKHSST